MHDVVTPTVTHRQAPEPASAAGAPRVEARADGDLHLLPRVRSGGLLRAARARSAIAAGSSAERVAAGRPLPAPGPELPVH